MVVTEEKEKAAVWGPHGWRAPEGAATVLVGTNAPPGPGWIGGGCHASACLPSSRVSVVKVGGRPASSCRRGVPRPGEQGALAGGLSSQTAVREPQDSSWFLDR